MTPEEVAEALQVSRAHVYRLIKAGRIPKLDLPGPIRVSRAWVEQLASATAGG